MDFRIYHNMKFILPCLCLCSLSIPPEDHPKTYGFFVISGCIKREHSQ